MRKSVLSISSDSTELYTPKVDSNISVSMSKVSMNKSSESKSYEDISMNKVRNTENYSEVSVEKSSKSNDYEDVLYTPSAEYSIQKNNYNEGVLVISRKGNLLAVNNIQYRTSIK